MCLSGKLFNSSHISKQRKRVWMFIGMMAINSLLRLKSIIHAMGGDVTDSPEKQTSESESPRKYGNDQIHAQGDLMTLMYAAPANQPWKSTFLLGMRSQSRRRTGLWRWTHPSCKGVFTGPSHLN